MTRGRISPGVVRLAVWWCRVWSGQSQPA